MDVPGGFERLFREGKAEGGSLSGGGIDPDPTTILVNDASADRQTDSGPCILILCMQTLKQPKNMLLILWVDTDSVVTYGEYPVPVLPLRRYAHRGNSFGAAVFDRIADQILKKLLQMGWTHWN